MSINIAVRHNNAYRPCPTYKDSSLKGQPAVNILKDFGFFLHIVGIIRLKEN